MRVSKRQASAPTKDKTSTPRSGEPCLTCRARKVRCDGVAPVCRACTRLRLSCTRRPPTQQVTWLPVNLAVVDRADCSSITNNLCAILTDNAHAEQPSSDGFRRKPLYTDDARRRMCRSLVDGINGTSVDGVLEDLENQLSLVPSGASLGPFSAFSLLDTIGSPSPINHQLLKNDALQKSVHLAADPSTSFDAPVEAGIFNFWEGWEINGALASSEADFWLGSDQLDPVITLPSPSVAHEVPIRPPSWNAITNAVDDGSLPEGDLEILEFDKLLPQLPLSQGLDTGENLPTAAVFLLKYYKDKVAGCYSALQSETSPWKVLYLPKLLEITGSLMLGSKETHTRMSLFYAILSVSAFNLDRHSSVTGEHQSQWWDFGKLFKSLAKQNLKMALQMEMSGNEVASYEELLMAILSMVTICATSGIFDGARHLLLDGEMLIAMRGLSRDKRTRNVVLLHNIFLYLRSIEDSLSVYISKPSTPLLGGSDAVVEVPYEVSPGLHKPLYGTPFPRSSRVDSPPDSHADAYHLWSEPEVFEQIYGVPASLLRLVTRTTNLEREMEQAKKWKAGEEGYPHDLADSVRALESDICDWKSPTSGDGSMASDGEGRGIIAHLVKAMHSAIIVFFYRRILNIHPLALQHYVQSTIESLKAQEEKTPTNTVPYTSIVWPAFVVGCEALSEKDRNDISSWLMRSAQRSGFRSFDVALGIVKKVWAAQKEKHSGTTKEQIIGKENRILLFT